MRNHLAASRSTAILLNHGLTNALPLIMMGKEVRADKAKKLGLVDVVCDLPSLEQLAIDCAKVRGEG